MPSIGDVTMAMTAGANAVSRPQGAPIGVEEAIAFALKRGLARRLPEQEAVLFEPTANGSFLDLAFGMGEAGDRGDSMLHQRGVTDEDHVGRASDRGNQTDIGEALELCVEFAPLRE